MGIKTVFFGSSPYSVIILNKLLTLTDFPIVSVVTKADKPVGRQQLITQNPVAEFSRSHNLPLLQPEEFTPEFISAYQALKPDLALCVAFGPPFFDQQMIDTPRYKIVNIHPSPLPKYRGATPGPWQIINGETQSAVTFFQIDAWPDHGPIIKQLPFPIDTSETSPSFYQKAFNIAADNLEFVLKDYINAPQDLAVQDHTQRSYFPKFSKESAKIDWTWPEVKIERFVRALNPWPIAWTTVKNSDGRELKMQVLSSKMEKNLLLETVQVEGKKPVLWSQISAHYQIIK